MMKNKPLLIFFGLLILLAGLAALDTYRNPLLKLQNPIATLPGVEPGKASDAESRALMSFFSGTDEYAHKIPSQDACKKISSGLQLTCIQGYYVADQMDRLKGVSLESGKILDAEVPARTDGGAIAKIIWYSSLGMAIAEFDLDISAAKKNLKEQDFYIHVVNGWAFYQLTKIGFENAEAKCYEKFEMMELNACRFGLGQASFYNPYELAKVKQIAPDFGSGYLFAQALFENQEVKAGQSFDSPMRKVAALIQMLWNGQTKELSQFKSLGQCLETKHPLDCAQYF